MRSALHIFVDDVGIHLGGRWRGAVGIELHPDVVSTGQRVCSPWEAQPHAPLISSVLYKSRRLHSPNDFSNFNIVLPNIPVLSLSAYECSRERFLAVHNEERVLKR